MLPAMMKAAVASPISGRCGRRGPKRNLTIGCSERLDPETTMLVGHYSLALIARRVEPRLSLATTMLAVALIVTFGAASALQGAAEARNNSVQGDQFQVTEIAKRAIPPASPN